MEQKEKFKIGYFENFEADNSKILWIAEGAPFEKIFNTKDEAEAYANGLQAIGGRIFENPIVEYLTLKVK
jgi:hypothetical protein